MNSRTPPTTSEKTAAPMIHSFANPPFSTDGARSEDAKIESKLKVSAISLCQSSDRGQPAAASTSSGQVGKWERNQDKTWYKQCKVKKTN